MPNPYGNFFASLPDARHAEVIQELLKTPHLRIERIVTQGQTTPNDVWYDQEEDEWVIVLQGSATVTFENGQSVVLRLGDYLWIPARQKHRVTWSRPDETTLWLALFSTP